MHDSTDDLLPRILCRDNFTHPQSHANHSQSKPGTWTNPVHHPPTFNLTLHLLRFPSQTLSQLPHSRPLQTSPSRSELRCIYDSRPCTSNIPVNRTLPFRTRYSCPTFIPESLTETMSPLNQPSHRDLKSNYSYLWCFCGGTGFKSQEVAISGSGVVALGP